MVTSFLEKEKNNNAPVFAEALHYL